MTTDPANLIDEIAADVAQELDRTGGEIVDAVKQDLSVPVEVTTGPRGGRKVIRSKPGEHARREFGELVAGVNHRVLQDGLQVSLVIENPVGYAKPLEDIDRIVTSDVPDRFTEKVTETIVNAIEKGT